MLPPLLLTGGPAAGKSTTARQLAMARPRAAVIDVDDIRHLVVAGHAAPWEGAAGARQQRLGVQNACDLARSFLGAGLEVVLADVVTTDTLRLYRSLMPSLRVVRLQLSLAEARRRATLRPVHLTEREFEDLHAIQLATDQPVEVVDVERLDFRDQVDTVMRLWSRSAGP